MNTEEVETADMKNKMTYSLDYTLPRAKGVRLKSVLVPEMLLAASCVSFPPMSSGHWDSLKHPVSFVAWEWLGA